MGVDDEKLRDEVTERPPFARCVSLDEMALEECHLVVNRACKGNTGDLDINFSVDGGLDSEESPELFEARCKGALRAKSEEEETFFDLTIVYVVVYKCDNVHKWPKEEVEYFKNRNVIIHCWPYMRELVDQMTRRANLGRVLLPLIPLPVRRKKEVAAQDARST